MKAIKTNKTAAIGLLMVLIVGFGQGTKPAGRPWQKYVEQEFYISGNYPKVEDVFEIVYRLKLKSGVEPKSGDYCAEIKCVPSEAIEIIGKERFFFSGVGVGEWKEFRTQCRILKPVSWIHIDGGIKQIIRGKSYGPLATGGTFLYLLDPETGQYGTKEEYEGNLPVEYRYDPVNGSFTCSPSQNPASVEENRRIIKMIRELEPRLNDSLALLLHSDQYRLGVPKGVSQWDSLNQRWIDKGVYEYYLRDGWLKALQEGKRDEWLKKEKAKIEQSWKGGSLNFFRPDNNHNTSITSNNFYPETKDGMRKDESTMQRGI